MEILKACNNISKLAIVSFISSLLEDLTKQFSCPLLLWCMKLMKKIIDIAPPCLCKLTSYILTKPG